MFPPVRVGQGAAADGSLTQPRAGRSLEQIVADGHARYQEPTYRQNMFSMTLTATTTGIAAGNIVGAAAAAATNFALFNPVGSGKNLVIVKFGMGVISGTPGAGPMFHGYIGNVPTAVFTGVPLNNFVNGPASVAKGYATAAGTTLTAGLAPVTLRIADFASSGTAAASPGELKAIEYVDGDIVIPPGAGWLPLWSGAGTSLLNGYSVTWEEIPL
jgi:hypothetical protein